MANHLISETPKDEDFYMHAHSYLEIFCLLSGDIDYSVEGYRYPMQPGDLAITRKNEAHHVVLRSHAKFERMYVQFEIPTIGELDPNGKLYVPFLERPLGKCNLYKASLFPEQRWAYYLEKICAYEEEYDRLYYLLIVLKELEECFDTVVADKQVQETDRVAAVMKYINKHISEEMTLGMLAERFQLSTTHLNKLFKESAGTTVWQYIIAKRLITARERILAGAAPTKVYQNCGFQDYTTFYRAYKQHFGISPKSDGRGVGIKGNDTVGQIYTFKL